MNITSISVTSLRNLSYPAEEDEEKNSFISLN